jgi:hypothetical protein
LGFHATTPNLILYSVEWQLRTKELKKLTFAVLWNEWLKVYQIKVELVIHNFTNRRWKGGQFGRYVCWEAWYGEWVSWMTGPILFLRLISTE